MSSLNLTNDWNNIIELKLNKWALLCNEYSLIHEQQSIYYSAQNKRLFIPSIILSSLSTIISGVSTGSNINNNIQFYWLSIATLILSGASTALITYTQTTKPEQKAAIHKSLSKTYKLIYYKIETELSLNINDRVNGLTFIKDISEQLQDLIQNSESASLSALNHLNITKIESGAPVVPLAPMAQQDSDIHIKINDEPLSIHIDNNTPIKQQAQAQAHSHIYTQEHKRNESNETQETPETNVSNETDNFDVKIQKLNRPRLNSFDNYNRKNNNYTKRSHSLDHPKPKEKIIEKEKDIHNIIHKLKPSNSLPPESSYDENRSSQSFKNLFELPNIDNALKYHMDRFSGENNFSP